jgi:hypothetical protein
VRIVAAPFEPGLRRALGLLGVSACCHRILLGAGRLCGKQLDDVFARERAPVVA